MDENNVNFKEFQNSLNLDKDSIEKRNQNLSNFIKNGFPSKKNEEWKFIDLNKIISLKISKLKFFNKRVFEKIDIKSVFKYIPIDISKQNYIISINGFIRDIFLNEEDRKKFEIVRTPKDSQIKINEPLNSLNNGLYLDYIKLIIKKGHKIINPLIFINLSFSNIESTNINQRFDVEMEENSCLSFLDLNLNSSQQSFLNISNKFTLREGAILKNYKIDFENNSNLYYSKTVINLYKNSISENFVISSGSDFAKNEIECNLKEDYSSAFVNGIIFLNETKQHEIRSKINHLSENTKSYQLIKCALKDKSKAVYQGKIFVDSVAQKTDGYQLSKAVLLDKETEFNGKPELEIYADDVKCSHGSSSGNLDENKIFYLMTRGLNKNEAKKILLDGFFLEVIEKITDNNIKTIIKELTKIK